MQQPDAEPAPALRRSLGLTDVALFFVITGSNLQWPAQTAAAGPSSLAVWIIGALAMYAPIAVVVVYLGSRFPEEGGLYVWSKRAFGPFAGFITGWTYWASNIPFFCGLLYFAAGNALFISAAAHRTLADAPEYFIAFALCGLALGTAVNVFGLDVGKWLNNIGAISRWAVIVVLVVMGAIVWLRFGTATAFTPHSLRPGLALKDIIFWSVIAFAWTGPEALSFMAGEVKRPQRSIPLGLAISAPVTAAVYVLGTASVLVILRSADVDTTSGVMQAIANAADRIGWPLLTPFVVVLVVVGELGSLGAWLGAVARIPFVAGLDHYLPTGFGRLHPRWHAPVTALIVQSAIAAGFILLGQGGTNVGGAYEVLVSTTVIATLVPFLYLFAAALKLTFEPSEIVGMRIPGGRLTVLAAAVVGFATTAISLVLAVFPADADPHKLLSVVKVVGMSMLLVGSGVAVYVRGSRRARRALRGAPLGEATVV